jgi:aconitate hydratase
MSVYKNSFNTKASLYTGNQTFTYFSLNKLADAGFSDIAKMPFCIRILLENLLRNEDGLQFTSKDIVSLAS